MEPGPDQPHHLPLLCSRRLAPHHNSPLHVLLRSAWDLLALPSPPQTADGHLLYQSSHWEEPGLTGSEGECALNLDVPRQQEVHRDSFKMGICSGLHYKNKAQEFQEKLLSMRQ